MEEKLVVKACLEQGMVIQPLPSVYLMTLKSREPAPQTPMIDIAARGDLTSLPLRLGPC